MFRTLLFFGAFTLVLAQIKLIQDVYHGNFLKFTIALKQQNIETLFKTVELISSPESPLYGNYLDQATIDKMVGSHPEHVKKVIEYLKSQNIQILETYADAIVASAPVYQLRSLFNIVHVYGNYDELMIQQPAVASYEIPMQIQDAVDFIEGFDVKRPFAVSDVIPKRTTDLKTRTSDDRYAGREALEGLYNFANVTINGQASICLVEYSGSGGFSNADLVASMQEEDEHAKRISNIVGENDFEDDESQLDVSIASVVADGADMWYWRTNSWLYSFAVDFQHREPAVPEVLSMSWGWSERDQCSITTCTNETSALYTARVNVEYAKLALRGVSIMASSGDAGAPGRTNEGCASGAQALNPILPGSSPFVTSVGATFISSSSGYNAQEWHTDMCKDNGCFQGSSEVAVSFDNIGWTAGGGFSINTNVAPWYQAAHVSHYLKHANKLPSNPFNSNGRGYPDVSAIGHSCPTWLSGELSGVDGTSCSAPLFAGVVATLNAYQKSRGKPVLGFANPVLYKMAETCDECFKSIDDGHNDCTEFQCCGHDFGFQALAQAWDPVTGLGTPNIGAMKKWLSNNI